MGVCVTGRPKHLLNPSPFAAVTEYLDHFDAAGTGVAGHHRANQATRTGGSSSKLICTSAALPTTLCAACRIGLKAAVEALVYGHPTNT